MASISGTFTWSGATSNAWSTSTNWNAVAGSAPFADTGTAGAAEYFVITGSGSNQPIMVTAGYTAGKITMTGGTLDIFGGELNATSPAVTGSPGAAFTMTGGTVNLEGKNGTGIALSYYTISVGNGATISGYGEIIDPAQGNASLGSGTIATSGTGAVIASGGTLTILGAGSPSGYQNMVASGNFQVSGSAALVLGPNATFSNGGGNTVTFTNTSGQTGLLVSSGEAQFSTSSGKFNATLEGMQSNSAVGSYTGASVIELIGVTSAQFDSAAISGTNFDIGISGGSYTIATSGINLSGLTLNSLDSGNNLYLWLDSNPCYAAGTRILTDRGEVPVEDLAEGDQVVVLSGAARELRPVKWIGNRRLDLRQHPQPNLAAPIRIRRDAFDAGMPVRDLLVSPDHAVFVDGKLIPAKYLVNGMTVVQVLDAPCVHYFHVELDRHAVILAEGLPAESYLDTGNRAMFANGGQALVLYPDFAINAGLRCWETDACAPLTVSQQDVNPVWDRLAARAEILGYQRQERAVTTEPALQLTVDGRAVKPVRHGDNRYVFTLPAGVSSLRLISRSGVPSELLPYPNDWRRLGVAIRRIVARDSAGVIEIPADHPALAQGWYQAEGDGSTMWRWTNGDAVLPIAMTDGPGVVEIELGCTTVYPSDNLQADAERLAA